MKTLTLLCSALIIIPASSQAREGGYGGFTQENIQEFYDYIHGQEMIKVQAGAELNQAIDAIPINLETEIDSDKLPALLAAEEKITCADIMLIVEEPSAFTPHPPPRRTPSFFRLLWDQDKKLWRHLEVFYSSGVEETYFFDLL